ncbi:gamma-1-syntrophin isoform X1 [Drosophila teissieri]|uniref:FI16515p1 n=6 Tax=melanogaster subgroup TaxID=32351 RepID=A1ZAH3_DROME|eukprot:NP_788381.1 Syntrophin-like 2, isoform E [Drosophila melanogaster]
MISGIMKLSDTMATPIEEKLDQNLKVRTGMVHVSDGKSRPEPLRLNLTMELLSLQKLEVVTPSSCHPNGPPMESKERMVQITRQKQGGLGLSIKGGAEHKLPILISRIYKDQAADITGQLFVGDAIIKVNGEYITACPHDDAVNILRNAGDIVVLTVKHYRAATPFLQKQLTKDTPDSDNDVTCAELKADEGYKSSVNSGTISRSCSRPMSICSEPEKRWTDVVAVPLMMAYVTRYIYGTDKLRQNAFEVRGLNGISTGVIHCDELAILSQWLKLITDNVVGLTHLQMKLYNRNFAVGERIEYMGWVNEGVINNNISWQSYKPRFLLLKGTEVMLFETPPLNVAGISKALVVYKVYQTMFRIVKESETVDSRQHCFLLQSSGHEPRYLSVETRQELLRIENSWNAAIVTSVIKLGRKTFAVSHHGKSGGLTLDWQAGFSLTEGAESATVWQYKFSQLRGSSDDGKSKLKLHFQDHDSRAIETKELECQVLQSLLFCMHAFLTAKVASVDPAFLSSIQQT